jgi:hypothetical protein
MLLCVSLRDREIKKSMFSKKKSRTSEHHRGAHTSTPCSRTADQVQNSTAISRLPRLRCTKSCKENESTSSRSLEPEACLRAGRLGGDGEGAARAPASERRPAEQSSAANGRAALAGAAGVDQRGRGAGVGHEARERVLHWSGRSGGGIGGWSGAARPRASSATVLVVRGRLPA